MSKTVTDQQLIGELGEQLVKTRVMQLGHVFQGRGGLETGIDGTIDFRDPITKRRTGRMVAVQVKTREKNEYDRESGAGFEYLMRPADVEFWRSGSLSVVLILHRRSDNSFYRESVAECMSGNERKLYFDKVADQLDAASMDRMAARSVERERLGTFVPPMRTGELAYLNLMRIGLPDEIFVADSPYASGRGAVPVLLGQEDRRFDWVIRNRRFVSFHDPRLSGVSAIVDPDTVEAIGTELIGDSNDPDDDLS